MSQSRAADDFETIRSRLDELRRERLRSQSVAQRERIDAGHRGPCACGLSLFPDECDGCCKAL
jgi:hypothetical protein